MFAQICHRPNSLNRSLMSLSFCSALGGRLEEEVFEVNDPDTDDPPPPLQAEIKNNIKKTNFSPSYIKGTNEC